VRILCAADPAPVPGRPIERQQPVWRTVILSSALRRGYQRVLVLSVQNKNKLDRVIIKLGGEITGLLRLNGHDQYDMHLAHTIYIDNHIRAFCDLQRVSLHL